MGSMICDLTCIFLLLKIGIGLRNVVRGLYHRNIYLAVICNCLYQALC